MKNYTIKQEGDEWVLYDSEGKKVLGRHKSKEGALAQERAIQARKGMFEALEIVYDDLMLVHAFENDLQTIKDVDVFAVGTWKGVNSPPEGDTYEEKDLDAMIEAFEAGVIKPNIKLTHGSDKEQVDIGRVANLKRVGKKLFADFVDIPKALYELMKKGLFKTRSAEVIWDLKAKDKVWPRVLKAVALLAPGQKPAVSLSEGYQFEALYCYEVPQPIEDESITVDYLLPGPTKTFPKWAGGEPGNFRQCVAKLKAKTTMSADQINRTCAEMHKVSTGRWPAQKHSHISLNLSSEDIEQINETIKREVKHIMDVEKMIKEYQKEDPSIKTEEDLWAFFDREIAKRDAAMAENKTYKEAEKETAMKDVIDFIEQAKKDGKLLPKHEEGIRKNFESLLEKQDEDGVKALKAFITEGPKRVELGEESRKDESKTYDVEKPPAGEVERLAREYIADGKAKDYATALQVVRTNHEELWKTYLAIK